MGPETSLHRNTHAKGSYGVVTPIDPDMRFSASRVGTARFIGRSDGRTNHSVSACDCSALHHEVTRDALRGCWIFGP
jgi:hypothetical protein